MMDNQPYIGNSKIGMELAQDINLHTNENLYNSDLSETSHSAAFNYI